MSLARLLQGKRANYLRLGARVVYVGAVTAVLFQAFSDWAYDDPFITYRYAENLSLGRGLVYNPGLQVLSTTSPFYALLLAAFKLMWDDLPRMANLVSALSLSLGGLFIWELARMRANSLVGWAGLLLYPSFPLLLTTTGSETPLYLAFCLGTFTFYTWGLEKGNFIPAGIFAGLAVLTRPDGVLIPAIIAADYLVRKSILRGKAREVLKRIRRLPWKAVFIFLGMVIPWFVFVWLYYGQPLPVTLAAKQAQAHMTITKPFELGLIDLVKSYGQFSHYMLEAWLVGLGLVFSVWRGPSWLGLLAWPLLYAGAYVYLHVPQYFWYFAPLVPGFVAGVGLGTALIFQPTRSDLRLFSSRIIKLAGFTLLVALAILQAADTARLIRIPDRRFPIYQAVGEWLQSHTPPEATVGTLEVGIIGYYAQRPMIDFTGLIQPEVAQQFDPEATYAETALWVAENFHPTYLALHDGSFPELEQEYVIQNCSTLRRFSKNLYGFTQDIVIYECQS